MERNVKKDLKNILGSAAERAELLVGQLADLDDKIANRDQGISKQVIDGELRPRRSAVHIKLTELRNETLLNVKKYVDTVNNEILRSDAARGDEVVDNADVRLLSSGYALTENDVCEMLRRNQNNRTATKQIFDYARKNGISTGPWVYHSVADRQADVSRCVDFANMFDHWLDKPGSREMLDKLLPEDE